MNNTLLGVELERIAAEQGVDLFGVADLTTAKDFIRNQGGEFLTDFPKAISLGVHLVDTVVDYLEHSPLSATSTYSALCFGTVNPTLDRAAFQLSRKIEEEGYRAYPIPAAQHVPEKSLVGAVSHKLFAHLAGLGWIGKSCLLVTPEYGPRVRLVTILIDAPLQPGTPMLSRCGDCTECIDICPVKAFTGVPFDPTEPLEVRFKAEVCQKEKRKMGLGICGLCVYICPYGKKR